MIFNKPQPFEEALQSREVRSILPTSESSAALQAIAPELRERAIFSARTTNAGYLGKIDEVITQIVSPETVIDRETGERRPARPGEGMDPATARLALKQALIAIDYQPDPEDRGGIKDLSSDARLNLVIDMNTKMAQGFGYWDQGQDPAILEQWPALELFRGEERELKRDWKARWMEAGGKIYQGNRMIAPKNDAIWTGISSFGLPYAPFDFNSGMDTREIKREEAVKLGVIKENTIIPAHSRNFNDDLEASAPVRSGLLFEALLESLGPTARFVEGALRLT